MMSWTMIMLLKNPRCLQIVRQELQDTLSDRPITLADVERLPYLDACMRETLRLYPSAPAHTVKLREDAASIYSHGLGEEQYLVKRGDIIRLNLMAIHRDPLVWGNDANEFKPERMMGESFEKLPRNAWKVTD
jgi:cytochrome P450 / NADPH-cytochrome P450 reductase